MALTKEQRESYGTDLLGLLPVDGKLKGNKTLITEFTAQLKKKGVDVSGDDYWDIRNALIAKGVAGKGKGKGGSTYRATGKLIKPAAKRGPKKARKRTI